MLIGDPSKFAIAWNIVIDWSTPTIHNGVFDVYVNFTLLGNRKNIVHEVGSNLFELLHHAALHLTQGSFIKDHFGQSDSEIYTLLNEYTFPSADTGQPEGREYLAVPFGVYDDGDVMFLVKDGDVDRLYYGSNSNFKGVALLPANEFDSVVREAWSVFQQTKDSVSLPEVR
ncbi:hypothetical protein HZ993_07815 [Rhodoferax sp. AJA081-3]|uniref:Imm42 family immunity protein n=1 Tax=Rhodoferax sp. AJA081-3 TaxID=2752316 RepID=UPI001ADF6820|nr:Imm42 family immunity protein [Rhodoferax sp. AJA081-3]QTN29704.1 hypothetical protein HZ993_07815 [Rhodoferax sp. AJA081-3]